jgi:Tol biopolymer transport system component
VQRFLALSLVLAIAIVVTIAWARRAPVARPPDSTLTWIAEAHQFGPVGYRDPAGAISPDGKWIAYSEGRFLRVRPVTGGPVVDVPPGDAQIRNLSWRPDSRAVLTDGFVTQTGWGVYDISTRTRERLWADRDDVRQATWSPTGRLIAAIVNGRDGQEVVTLATDGRSTRVMKSDRRISFPTWTPRGEVACITTIDGRPRVTIPCGGAAIRIDPDADAYGPMAFSTDGATLFVSLANAAGTVDLWSVPAAGGRARRLTAFSRDAYAPSVAADGSVVFKVQSYRTSVAIAPSDGGPTRPLASSQSETPSWDPSGRWLGITYGSWRRVPDDAKYPDIAQDAGIIAVDPEQPATAPARVVHASASEDQSLCWSPNGKWIAFHSHKDQSDDIWLRAADGAADARRISFLGRGAETGWPRWSPDGRWLLFDGASQTRRKPVMYLAGIDQTSGSVTQPPREISLRDADIDVSHGEWLPDSTHIVAIAKAGAGRHVILTTDVDGRSPTIVRRFESEHDNPGLGVSPDGRQVAFIAPAADGYFQVWRVAIAGGAPTPVTTDASNKTQPAWSPDGRSIAFTVWNYDAQFWKLTPR